MLTRDHTLTDQLCPCGCGAYLKSNQKAASDACKKRIRRAAQKVEGQLVKAKAPHGIKVVARPDDSRRPSMMYFGMMNIPTRYADSETVEIVCGHTEAITALTALARQLDGAEMTKPGPTGIPMLEALVPLAGLQTMMMKRATVEPKHAPEPLPLPGEPPSPLLLQRASVDSRAANPRHKEKYRNPNAQATRWRNGVPVHVQASLAIPDRDDPDWLPSDDAPEVEVLEVSREAA